MAKYTNTISADGSVYICQIDRRRSDANAWQADIFIGGTFGSGTVKIQLSPDQGTTKYDLKDWNGTNMSSSSAVHYTSPPVGNGDKNSDFITLYAVMTGSTDPNVLITVFDNR